MRGVLAAEAAVLAELQPLRRLLLVLRGGVVPPLAVRTLENDVVAHGSLVRSYSTISATVPAPTVRPPSRIAKRSPHYIAMGMISSPEIDVLSPGITISTPSGRCATPVTSVVRKQNCGRNPEKNGVGHPPS